VRAMTSHDAARTHFGVLLRFLPRENALDFSDVDRIVGSGVRSLSTSLCGQGVEALGRIGPEAERQAAVMLAGMLEDDDESRRLSAADALGALGPKATPAIPALIALAERTTSPVFWEKSQAVNRIMPALASVCAADDPRLVAALRRLMRSRDPTQRHGAASMLSSLDRPPAALAEVLVAALGDEVQGVRYSAAVALGRYAGAEREAAVPALIDALRDEDTQVRCQAARSLARLGAGASQAIPIALDLLRSENANHRWQAAEILGAYGTAARRAAPALESARHDPELSVRHAAENALKAIAPPAAVAPGK